MKKDHLKDNIECLKGSQNAQVVDIVKKNEIEISLIDDVLHYIENGSKLYLKVEGN